MKIFGGCFLKKNMNGNSFFFLLWEQIDMEIV